MAWCRQATSHYLSQCWPKSTSPYGTTRPQSVNSMHGIFLLIPKPSLTKASKRVIFQPQINKFILGLSLSIIAEKSIDLNLHIMWACTISIELMYSFYKWSMTMVMNIGTFKVLRPENAHVHLGISLGMHPANERRRYNVTMSLIGWAHT